MGGGGGGGGGQNFIGTFSWWCNENNRTKHVFLLASIWGDCHESSFLFHHSDKPIYADWTLLS